MVTVSDRPPFPARRLAERLRDLRESERLTQKPPDLSYIRYARYADLDALVEVFGHVKIDNPALMVRILPEDELAQDFALHHLIIIGDVATDAASLFAQDIPLPVPEEIWDTDPVTHFLRYAVGGETRWFRSERDRARTASNYSRERLRCRESPAAVSTVPRSA
jgi:hypothetical protein